MGIPSDFDHDNKGNVCGPADAFGFGFFLSHFGMAIYSQFPIDFDSIRTFQLFLWKDMPGALLPDDPDTPAPADWYSPDELEVFRLSSKSHWEVPIQVQSQMIQFLVSQPTPPLQSCGHLPVLELGPPVGMSDGRVSIGPLALAIIP